MTDRDAILLKAADAVSALGIALRELVALRDAEEQHGPAVTYHEAALRLSVSKRTVERLVGTRQLQVVKVGKKLVRIPESSLRAYESRRRTA